MAQVTIVIPAYNAAATLRETLASVQAQDGVAWQAVVVDDASSDDTLSLTQELAAADSRIQAIAMEHGGVSVARNRGLEASDTPWTLFLDADDVLLDGALQHMLDTAAKASPQVVALYGEAQVFQSVTGRTGATGAPVFGKRPEGNVLTELIQHNFVCTPGVCLVRTETIKAVGGFQPGLRLSEDWVLWCALAAEGEFSYLGIETLLAYRQTEGGVSHSIGQDMDVAEACIEAVYQLPAVQALDPQQRQQYRKMRTASAYAFMGTQAIKQRDFASARKAFMQSLQRNPGAVRQWILLLCSMFHCLPAAVERRLK